MDLFERLKSEEPFFVAWSTHPSPLLAAALGRTPFEGIVLDLQHGMHDEASAFASIAGISTEGKPALLRIPVGRNDLASRALDAGCSAVIAPMINSLAEAEAFAAAMKYPPLGERSFGPSQALRLDHAHTVGSYFKAANSETLALAMIETRAAVEICDDILALDGIDGVFVGPADLSISWTEGAKVDPDLPATQPVLADIADKALAAGKIPAIYATSPEAAVRYADLGYRLISAASDEQILRTGAAAILGRARLD
ncbi:HpcH/HpaI aldolase family protein [Pseudohoeflea coraliihabitans]